MKNNRYFEYFQDSDWKKLDSNESINGVKLSDHDDCKDWMLKNDETLIRTKCTYDDKQTYKDHEAKYSIECIPTICRNDDNTQHALSCNDQGLFKDSQ